MYVQYLGHLSSEFLLPFKVVKMKETEGSTQFLITTAYKVLNVTCSALAVIFGAFCTLDLIQNLHLEGFSIFSKGLAPVGVVGAYR